MEHYDGVFEGSGVGGGKHQERLEDFLTVCDKEVAEARKRNVEASFIGPIARETKVGSNKKGSVTKTTKKKKWHKPKDKPKRPLLCVNNNHNHNNHS